MSSKSRACPASLARVRVFCSRVCPLPKLGTIPSNIFVRIYEIHIFEPQNGINECLSSISISTCHLTKNLICTDFLPEPVHRCGGNSPKRSEHPSRVKDWPCGDLLPGPSFRQLRTDPMGIKTIGKSIDGDKFISE